MIYQGSQQSVENIRETSRFLAELGIKPLLCPINFTIFVENIKHNLEYRYFFISSFEKK